MSLAGRAKPMASFIAGVAVGIPYLQSKQLLLGLAFFPSRRGLSNDEVVGGVKNAQPSSVRAFVVELKRRRLIVILKYIRVMFEFVNGGEFDAVTFELNGHAHLPAGIPAAYVVPTASHTARRIGSPYVVNDLSGL